MQRRGAGPPWRGSGSVGAMAGSRRYALSCALAAVVLALGCELAFAQGGARDPLARLGRWIASYSGAETEREWERDSQELERLLDEIGALDLAVPQRRVESTVALLDLASLQNAAQRRSRAGEPSAAADARTLSLRKRARALLQSRLANDPEGALSREIAVRVLADSNANPLGRRIAAVELFRGRQVPAVATALLFCADPSEPALERAALDALAGWSYEAVHRRMAQELARSLAEPARPAPVSALRHFAEASLPAESPARASVRSYLSAGAASSDWRDATRAVSIADALGDEDAVPVLIEALRTWIDRRASARGSRRVECEIVAELERRSGTRIGAHPDRWTTWWRAVRAGKVAPRSAEDEKSATRAEFFGLRLITDRVVFVIDRSGSMDQAFGTRGDSRYEEAVAELFRCVDAIGPTARVRVVLFSDEVTSFSRGLAPMAPAHRSDLERWLAAQRPGGGTLLRPGIAEAFELAADGAFDPARMDADTVIVLCDGATAEGPEWVAPLLERIGPEACAVIHAVQVGPGGDGALQELARASGGEYRTIEP